MPSIQIGELAALGTAVLWTLSTLTWTVVGHRVGALAVSFLRLLVTSVFLAAYGGVVRDRWLPTDADASTWLVLGLSGLTGFFMADVCGFKALLLIGPRLTLLVLSLTPPASAIIAWFWLGEALTARHWLAMAVTLTGIVWVVLERQEAATATPRERHLGRGLALAVVAALAQAVGMVLGRQGIGEYDAVAATFVRVLGDLPGYFVLVTVLARWPSIFKAVADVRAMRLILMGSIIGPVLGVTCLMVALRHCSAGIVTTIVSTMPVLVLPFSVLLFGEKISLRATLGAIVAVIGVALMCWNGE